MKPKAQSPTKDILQAIIFDHNLLRESIFVLKDEDALPSEKKRQLERFIFNLKVHARAEENSLYEALVGFSETRAKILEGFEEHNIADHLVAELSARSWSKFGSTDWSDEIEAKAKVLAEVIEHHIDEEEQDWFPEIRAYLTKTELTNLGVVYQHQRKELRSALESRLALPSIETVSWTVLQGFKDMTSYVSSKLSNSR